MNERPGAMNGHKRVNLWYVHVTQINKGIFFDDPSWYSSRVEQSEKKVQVLFRKNFNGSYSNA